MENEEPETAMEDLVPRQNIAGNNSKEFCLLFYLNFTFLFSCSFPSKTDKGEIEYTEKNLIPVRKYNAYSGPMVP